MPFIVDTKDEKVGDVDPFLDRVSKDMFSQL